MNSTKINVSDLKFAGKAEYIITLQHCVETNEYLLNWLINSTPWMVKLGPFDRTTLFSIVFETDSPLHIPYVWELTPTGAVDVDTL